MQHRRWPLLFRVALVVLLGLLVLAECVSGAADAPVIGELRAEGRALAELIAQLGDAVAALGAAGAELRFELHKAPGNAEFAPTRTAELGFLFLDTSVADIIRLVCAVADLKYRRDGVTFVIGDGTVALAQPAESRFAVTAQFWDDVRAESGGAVDSAALRAFVSRRCLPLPGDARLRKDTTSGALLVAASAEAAKDCEELLRHLEYFEPPSYLVKTELVILSIPDGLPARDWNQHLPGDTKQTSLDAVLAACPGTRAVGRATVSAELGQDAHAVTDAGQGRARFTVGTDRRWMDKSETLLCLELAVEWVPNGAGNGGQKCRLKQQVMLRSGCGILLQLPSAEDTDDPFTPTHLLVTSRLLDAATGREHREPIPSPEQRSPLPHAMTVLGELIMPEVRLSEQPFAEALTGIWRWTRKQASAEALPGLALILPVQRGDDDPSRTLTMHMDNIPVNEVLRYTAMGAGLTYRFEDRMAVLADKSVPLDSMSTAFFAFAKGFFHGMPPVGVRLGLGAELKEFFGNFGVSFPEGAGIWADKRSRCLVVRNTASALRKLHKCMMIMNIEPTQVRLRAATFRIDDASALLEPRATGLNAGVILDAIARSGMRYPGVKVCGQAELTLLSGVSGTADASKGDSGIAFSATPTVQPDGYTIDLAVTWQDCRSQGVLPKRLDGVLASRIGSRPGVGLEAESPLEAGSRGRIDLGSGPSRLQTTLSLWDGQAVMLRGPQRVLVLSARILGSRGQYVRELAQDDWTTPKQVDDYLVPAAATKEDAGDADADTQAIRDALERITIPLVEFEDVPLSDVIPVLKESMQRHAPAGNEGISVFLKLGNEVPASPGAGAVPAALTMAEADALFKEFDDGQRGDDFEFGEDFDLGDFGGVKRGGVQTALPHVSIFLDMVSLLDVIRALCWQARLKWRLDPHALIIAEPSSCLSEMETRFYATDWSFQQLLRRLSRSGRPREAVPADEGDDDDDDGDNGDIHSLFRDCLGLLRAQGTRCAPYARTGKLSVHGPVDELPIIEQFLSLGKGPVRQVIVRIEPPVETGRARQGQGGMVLAAPYEFIGTLGREIEAALPVTGAGLDAASRFVRLTLRLGSEVRLGRLACDVTAASTGGREGVLLEQALDLPLAGSVEDEETVSAAEPVSVPLTGPLPLRFSATVMDLSGRAVAYRERWTVPDLGDIPTGDLQVRMRAAQIAEIAFDGCTLSQAMAVLRRHCRELEPKGNLGNFVLRAELLPAANADAEAGRITAQWRDCSVLSALERLCRHFDVRYRIGRRVVFIGVPLPRYGWLNMHVPLGRLGVSDEVVADDPGKGDAEIRRLLRCDGVVFAPRDRACYWPTRRTVLAVGSPSFLDGVEEAVRRLNR